MNRRSFLVGLTAAFPTVVAAHVAKDATFPAPKGLRIDASSPPREGFEYMGSRRYRVFCDGVLVERCVRVDQPAGIAWQRTDEVVAISYVRLESGHRDFEKEYGEREVRGVITLERIQ